MKKFVNDSDRFVDEMLEGLLAAYPDLIRSVREDNKALVRSEAPRPGKVGIVTGGGSGHLPLFLGYVGRGLLDGVAVGDVFQSPSPEQILDATRAVHSDGGVLYIYGNYGGDVMNFDMAGELALAEGIRTETVIGTDDVASMPPESMDQRRGVAGIFFLYKCAGALAEQGAELDAVTAIARKAQEHTRTMGVALSPCIIPAVGKPGFSIGENEMELGMGIHGEAGIERSSIKSAREVTGLIYERLVADMPLNRGDHVSVLVNGLGATPPEELYIIYREIDHLLKRDGVSVHRCYVGEYATSMEMAGLSVSFLKTDEELAGLLDAPFVTPFHVQPVVSS
jgi:dihydroxyacetone kinase